MKLRPYQTQGVLDIEESWLDCNKLLFQLATGGGKTVIFSELVKKHQDRNILIVVHREEIIFQIHNTLKTLNIDSGIMVSGYPRDLSKNIQIASNLTLISGQNLEHFGQNPPDFFIIDEAHHAGASSYVKITDYVYSVNEDCKMLGVTATPTRKNKRTSLGKTFQKLISSISIKNLILNGWLSDFMVYCTPTPDLSDVDMSNGDYKITSLSQYMRQTSMIDHLVNSYIELAPGKKMIVFCVDQDHAKAVADAYASYDFVVRNIDAKTKRDDRRKYIQDFRDGVVQIITCCMVLTEGFDVPDCEVIQLARPTKSLPTYMQMAGRGLRISISGDKLIILDNAGCTIEHGMIDSPKLWSLNDEIDPNYPNRFNIILAQKKNGQITDDLNEMDMLRVRELTPEQYIQALRREIRKLKLIKAKSEYDVEYLDNLQNRLQDFNLSIKFRLLDEVLEDKREFILPKRVRGEFSNAWRKNTKFNRIILRNKSAGSTNEVDFFDMDRGQLVHSMKNLSLDELKTYIVAGNYDFSFARIKNLQ